jgi:acyl dehydratase
MTDTGFTTAIDDRYFEDYAPGSVHEFGSLRVEQDEVIAFAQKYDPQSFHVDPDKAKESIFGGLIASGWQTGGMMMRMYADHYLSHVASLASPGLDELRWPAPVRPGDELSLRVTVEAARRSKSKPDRGIVHSLIEVLNQNRDVVMSMKVMNMLLCRGPEVT